MLIQSSTVRGLSARLWVSALYDRYMAGLWVDQTGSGLSSKMWRGRLDYDPGDLDGQGGSDQGSARTWRQTEGWFVWWGSTNFGLLGGGSTGVQARNLNIHPQQYFVPKKQHGSQCSTKTVGLPKPWLWYTLIDQWHATSGSQDRWVERNSQQSTQKSFPPWLLRVPSFNYHPEVNLCKYLKLSRSLLLLTTATVA